ncbi:MAG: glycosyltransferase [Bacilli bacterium]|nr:glycosyltransferase [Bacilli bacterium]
MELSIIIPVYNTPINILERCIESIKKIEKINYEIIIVNDGSTKEKSEQYQKLIDSNIFVYDKNNGGVSSARNYGIDKSKGKYIMFVDSDDIIFSEVLDSKILLDSYDIIFYNETIVKDNGKKIIQKELRCGGGKIDAQKILEEFILFSAFHSPCSKLFRKSLIKSNNIMFDENMIQAEDAIFNLRFLQTNPSCYYVNSTLYGYYYSLDNSQGRLKKDAKKRISNAEYLFEEMIKINTKNFNNSQHFLEQINYRYVKCMFTICTELLTINLKDKQKFLEYISANIDRYCKIGIECSKSTSIKKFLIKKKLWIIIKILSKIREMKIKIIK